MTNADVFSGSTGSMDTAQPELEYSIGRLDQTHSIKLNTVFELPFGPGKRWLNERHREPHPRRLADCGGAELRSGLPIGVTTGAAPLPIFNGTNRPNVTGADWRAPIAGDEFNPLVDRYLNRAAFSAAGRRSWGTRLASTATCGGPGTCPRTSASRRRSR